jgi:hypothetical protein
MTIEERHVLMAKLESEGKLTFLLSDDSATA